MSKPQPKPHGWDEYYVFLLGFEGVVLENDPDDNGGLTKYGVDKASHPGVDIAKLTRETAEQIHLADYHKTKAERLPYPLNFAYFDLAMNAGEDDSIKVLQTLGRTSVDGVWGPVTERAVKKILGERSLRELIVAYHAEREKRYKNLAFTRAKLAKYLNGWLRRTKACNVWCAARLPKEVA
jgi:lysozyme family protein